MTVANTTPNLVRPSSRARLRASAEQSPCAWPKNSIINVASMAGLIGLGAGAAYGATKVASLSLTRSWAAEFSPAGRPDTWRPPAGDSARPWA
jgi:NAD(P)-dependent dehydrogenase (short-subunit alcohol dehydrogenase family)